MKKKKQVTLEPHHKAESSKQPVVKNTYRWLYLIIFAFAFILYANTIPNFYNLDDELVTQNHKLTSQGIKAIPAIFTSPYYSDDQGYAYEYRPVVLTSFAIEHQFLGENPHVSHFINVVLYAVTAVLLLKLLLLLFSGMSILLPLIATLLFVAHPLHTEVVASIKNRDELLMLLGGLGAIYTGIRYLQAKEWKFFIAIILCYLVAILSKLNAIPFAFLLPLAVILFRDVHYKSLLPVAVILGILTAIITPLPLLVQKIMLFAAISITPVIVWYLMNPNEIYSLIKKNLVVKNLPSTDVESDDGYLLTIKSINLKQVFIILSIASILAVAFLYLLPVVSFAILSLTAFFFWLYFDKTFLRTIALVVPALIIGFFLFQFHYPNIVSTVFLVFLALLLNILQGKRKWEIAPALLIVLFFNIGDLGSFFFATFVFFLYLKYRFKFIPIFIILVTSAFVLSELDKLRYVLETSLVGLIILFSVYLLSKNKVKHIYLIFILLTSILPIPYLFGIITSQTIFQSTTNQIVRTPTPEIFESLDRPLTFEEMPVSYNDPVPERIATGLLVLGKYLKLMLVPHPLGFYYGYAEVKPTDFKNLWVWVSLFAHLLLVIAAVYYLRKKPIVSFALIFYLLNIVFFSNFYIPVAGMMGDRFTYAASVGFSILLAYLLLSLFKINFAGKPIWTRLKTGFVPILAVILVLYSFKTVSRNADWKDSLTLFKNDIAHLTESAQAHNLLATHLVVSTFQETDISKKNEILNDAVGYYKRAVEIYPGLFNAWYDLGRTYQLQNKNQPAIEAFKQAIEVVPTNSISYKHAGYLLEQTGKKDEAIELYKLALERIPDDAELYTLLSALYIEKNEFDKVLDVHLTALKHLNNPYESLVKIGRVYYNMNDREQAIYYFEQAYKVNPNDLDLLQTLSGISQESGNMDAARFYYQRAQMLQGR